MDAAEGGDVNEPARPLLDVRHVVQEFVSRDSAGRRAGVVHAVSDVSFTIASGETLGIVGESGSGKSTVARSVLQIPSPKSGEVWFRGTELTALNRREMRAVWRQVQLVFQDPFGSLDATWSVARIVAEPLTTQRLGTKRERSQRVAEMLEKVGLSMAEHGDRRPRELSGGQCQRVAIARALATSPELVVCDEAVSSLDVLVQAQVLALFEQLRDEFRLAYLFVSHDLAVVKEISHRVAVMYLGRLCEVGPTEAVYESPMHPYTAALLDAVPTLERHSGRRRLRATIAGEVPSALAPPSGCRFRTRCPFAQVRCAIETPEMRPVGPGREVACHFPLNTVTDPQQPAPGCVSIAPTEVTL